MASHLYTRAIHMAPSGDSSDLNSDLRLVCGSPDTWLEHAITEHLRSDERHCWCPCIKVPGFDTCSLARMVGFDRHHRDLTEKAELDIERYRRLPLSTPASEPAERNFRSHTGHSRNPRKAPTPQSIRRLLRGVGRICKASRQSQNEKHSFSIDEDIFTNAEEALDYFAWSEAGNQDTHRHRKLSGSERDQASLPGNYRRSVGDGDWHFVFEIPASHRRLLQHFAVRAGKTVTACIRNMSTTELFASTTTAILPGDPDWPYGNLSWHEQFAILMRCFNSFLSVANNGSATLPVNPNVQPSKHRSKEALQGAHYFMARVCLQHIQDMCPRLLLRPWLQYSDFLNDSRTFPLHEYVVSFWHRHYSRAEPHANDLILRLQELILLAWQAERCAPAKPEDSFEAHELQTYVEAREVGLIFSREHGFTQMESAYSSMGVTVKDEKSDTSDRKLTGTDATKPDLYVCLPIRGRNDHCTEAVIDGASDVRDWELLEPDSWSDNGPV